MKEELTTILRTSGERTTELALKLLEEEVGTVHVVEEKPFQKALERSFQLAIEHNRPWTLMIDADLLVAKNALLPLFKLAKEAPPSTFCVGGNALDKLLGISRNVGNNLYRTSLLEKALSFIPGSYNKMRPEKYIAEEMERLGSPLFIYPACLLGIHDEEQYFRDIYRKCFVHAHKHLYKAHTFIPRWQRQSTDPDFLVALHGFADGIQHGGEVAIDARLYPADDALNSLNIKEKGTISLAEKSDIAAQMIQFQLLNC